MLKPINELLKLNFSVTGNFLYDLIIGAVIFAILEVIAFRIVGRLYRSRIIDGRQSGSFLNFTIRIVATLAIMFLIKVSIK